MISSNCSWKANTNYICKTATKRCWLLHRLKNLGATREQLLSVYQKRSRTILEMAAPAWHSSLTKEEIYRIEREQKKAFAIILGNEYNSYKNALSVLKQETLEKRRENMTIKFAKKCAKNPKHSNMFPRNTMRQNLRTNKKYKEYECRTKRLYDSAIPYMTRLLNKLN